jgi:hypothetical protein
MHPSVDGRGELRLFRGRGVGRDELARHTGALQRYWAWFDVAFFTRHPPIRLPLEHVLTISPDAVRRRVKEQTGLDPSDRSLTAEQERRVGRASDRAVLHNLVELVRAYGTPVRSVVHLVILPRIVDDEGMLERMFGGSVLGLGLAPSLLDATDEDVVEFASLLRQAEVPGDFTPFALVGADAVERALQVPDLAVAHEVGHAYGLAHTDLAGNLMSTGSQLCSARLEQEQLETVRSQVQTGALRTSRVVPLQQVLLRLVEAVRRRVRAR